MRRVSMLMILLLWAALAALPAAAQEPQPEPDPAALQELLNQAQDAAARAEAAVEEAEQRVEWAFNLLGLFEAFGLIVTVAIAAIGAFGITRLFSAQSELAKARERVESELEQVRTRVQKQLEEKESELEDFRSRLQRDFESERETTARALLAQSLLPLGDRQYRAQDYTGALDTYGRALELDPNNPVIHYKIGYVSAQSGDMQRAVQHYQAAMELEGDFAPAMAGLGFALRRIAEKLPEGLERERRFNEAESMMLQALHISPKLVDEDGESWWGALGGLYRRRGQTEQAMYAYQQATIVTPHSSYGYGNLALLYMEKNDRARMLETYRRAERLAWAEAQAEVNNYWGYADVVVARLALGRSDEVDEPLTIALDIASSETPYQLNMLIDTLSRLEQVVEPGKVPAIESVIARIRAHIREHYPQDGG